MAEEGSGERSLPATEQRLRRARETGQVALSREVVTAFSLAAAAVALAMMGKPVVHALAQRLVPMLSALDLTPGVALQRAGAALLFAVIPFLCTVLVAGSAGTLLQTGFLLNPSALMPDVSRVGPSRGLSRLFGTDALAETAKAIAKVSVLGWAGWRALQDASPGIVGGLVAEPAAALDRLLQSVVHLFVLVLACQTVIAVIDVAWVRMRFHARLRMSAQEIKQEHREAEGDPRYKSRLKQIRLGRARRRMLAAIPKATVVITNPTHYAIALRYDRGGAAAPTVVAKGLDEVAARIRLAARKHGVTMVANPPLARALYTVPVDAEVPAEHFKAVAEIIAYVWRLKSRAQAGGPR